MPAPLLKTKLRVPTLRTDRVSRPQLVGRLSEGLNRRVTLLSAPPGYGKTTLLCEWVSQCGRPAAWLSLEEADNDPSRFLAYFIAALQTVDRELGAGVPRMMQVPQQVSPEEAITLLVNDMAEFSRPLIVVLDDYHLIEAEPIHEMLRELVEHIPPNLHLVIASRADPPLPLARLRGRGCLNELRLAELRFTGNEAREFLNGVMRLGLSVEDVKALASRTEGWIAGLQMAAVSMQGREDLHAFVQAFAGSDRVILDYLVEEVFGRQPGALQDFLLETSILDRMTGPLCDAVTGRIDSQAVLDGLERANLFLVPLDGERTWYRYHRLFADLLQNRLLRSRPTRISELHRRACDWFEEHGYFNEAVDHAFAASEFERAASLVEGIAETTLMRGEVATFVGWVEDLPASLRRKRHSLEFFYAAALLISGRSLDGSTASLEAPDKEDRGAQARAAALRGYLAAYRGELDSAAELSAQALSGLSEEDTLLHSAARWIRTVAHLYDVDLDTSAASLAEIAGSSEKAGNIAVAASAWSDLAAVQARKGELREAKRTYERVLHMARDDRGSYLPVAAEALIGLGDILRERNDLEGSTAHLEKGVELAKRWNRVLVAQAYAALSRVRAAQGDWAGAQQAVDEARESAAGTDLTTFDDLIADLSQAYLWLTQKKLDALEQWGREKGADRPAELDQTGTENDLAKRVRRYQLEVWVRLLVARGRTHEALPLLDRLASMMEKLGRKGRLIEIWLLQALVFQAQGKLDSAMMSVRRALEAAALEGYTRIFVDLGPPMAKLLYGAMERGIAPEYTRKLLAAFPTTETESAQKRQAAGELEPLSERELEVLRLIADGLGNREIAAKLVISLSTAKTHTRNLYAKLGVSSRTQALAEARRLGIL